MSPKIPSLEEIRQEIITEYDRTEARNFRDSVRPLYFINNNDQIPTKQNPLKHIGSCTLFSVFGRKFIISAAHVMRNVYELYKSGLWVRGKDNLVLLTSKWLTTHDGKSNINDDRFDFAMTELTNEDFVNLENLNFLDENQIYDDNKIISNMFFMALGHPHSKNKKIDHKKRNAGYNHYAYYCAATYDEKIYGDLGIKTDSHLVLDYPKRFRDVNGKTINTIGRIGMSGGGLFHICDLNDVYKYVKPYKLCTKLAGILIEYNKKMIIAVRIKHIIQIILDKYFVINQVQK